MREPLLCFVQSLSHSTKEPFTLYVAPAGLLLSDFWQIATVVVWLLAVLCKLLNFPRHNTNLTQPVATARQSAVPVISGRQECSHSGNFSPARAPCFGCSLTPICWGVGGYAYQVALDALQHLTHKLANVLAQSLHQAAEEVACSC